MENFWKNINRKVSRFENFEIKFQYRGFPEKRYYFSELLYKKWVA
jgi:hypothetical protein